MDMLGAMVELYANGELMTHRTAAALAGHKYHTTLQKKFPTSLAMRQAVVEYALSCPHDPKSSYILLRAAMDDDLLPLIPPERRQEAVHAFARRVLAA
jgi:hypothetical protein